MLASYLTGLLVCGGIIIAIGAQNTYLLGQAIRREYHWWTAGLCMSTDVLLLTIGMLGVSAVLMTMPGIMAMLRWGGVLFLSWLSLQAFRRTTGEHRSLAARGAEKRSLKAVVLTTLAVTLLNPHVYLDTLLLIPAIGAQQEDPLYFVAGASSASILWFALLAWGGATLAPWLSRPVAWRVIDGGIGIMMAAIAVQLALKGV